MHHKEDCDLEHGPDGRSTLVPRSWNARRFNRDLVWGFAHSQPPPGPVVPNQFRPFRSRMLAEVWRMFGDVRGRSRTMTETTFDSVSRRSCGSVRVFRSCQGRSQRLSVKCSAEELGSVLTREVEGLPCLAYIHLLPEVSDVVSSPSPRCACVVRVSDQLPHRTVKCVRILAEPDPPEAFPRALRRRFCFPVASRATMIVHFARRTFSTHLVPTGMDCVDIHPLTRTQVIKSSPPPSRRHVTTAHHVSWQ